MQFGTPYKFGDIVLCWAPYVEENEMKKRPGLVLYQEYGNLVVIGITSNNEMKGITITKQEGMIVDSIIKMNYVFTIPKEAVIKELITLSQKKKEEVKNYIVNKLI